MTEKIIASNVVDLLNSFTTKELERFMDFVAAPCFSTDKRAIVLLNLLQEHIIHKQAYTEAFQFKFFKTILPEKKLANGKLGRQEIVLLNAKMSLLYKKIKQFICVEELEENSVCQTTLLYEGLLKKRQYKHMERELNKDKKALDNAREKGMPYYNYAVKVEEYLLQYYYQHNLIFQKDNIQEINACLDIRYVLDKLRLELTALSLSRISAAKNYDLKIQETISATIKLPHCEENPLVQIYQLTNQLMTSDDAEIYHALLNTLENYNSIIPKSMLNDFYVVAVNFCTQQIRRGVLEYNKILSDLYRVLDTKNLLLEAGYMPLDKLRNIVILSCQLEEFDWAEHIIEKYRVTLNKDFRESACSFNYGVVAFYKNDYKTAISNFIRVEKTILTYDINTRVLLLKSHFELDEDYDERTMRIFRSAEQYFRQNKSLTTPRKKAFKNFILILVNLYRYRHKAGKKSITHIREKLEGFEYVNDKRWLLEKVSVLEGRKRWRS